MARLLLLWGVLPYVVLYVVGLRTVAMVFCSSTCSTAVAYVSHSVGCKFLVGCVDHVRAPLG